MAAPKFKATLSAVDDDQTPPNSIGGQPYLPLGVPIPSCRNCGEELLTFLQFDIEEAWRLPQLSDSHLVVMMCPRCNEIPTFETYADGKLPAEFWNETEGHFFAACMSSNVPLQATPPATLYLKCQELSFEPSEEEGYVSDMIRMGGEPIWLQDPEPVTCGCGAKMLFVAQISENFPFEKLPDAPEQPDSFSADDYCLFLGNEIYIFACPQQCDLRSVWITVQG